MFIKSKNSLSRGIIAIDFSSKKLKISDFSKAISSSFLKFSACADPIFVIIDMLGFATLESFLISPGEFMPSSSIHSSVFFGIFANDRGIPISLLKFPIVQYEIFDVLKISYIHSFNVVLPLLPVTQTVIKFLILFLEYFANSIRAL